MRIGFDATALPPHIGGAGNYIVQLIRAFARLSHKHKFVIFAHQSGYSRIATNETESLEWVIVKDKPPYQRLIWEQTSLSGLAQKAGINLLHSPHYTRPLKLSCKSVVTFHDMTFFLMPQMHSRSKRIFFPRMIRYSAKHANAIITDSESTRNDTIRLLDIQSKKVKAIHLGVDESFKKINDQQKLNLVLEKYELPEHFILFVGTLEPRKNLPVLLHALKHLIDKGCTTPLAIVGSRGWGYDEIFQLVNKLHLEKFVHFTGYVEKQDLPVIYNLASIFVYPSVYEGFGLPPLEAMACGTPAITTNVSSMPEYAGDAGILIPPNDENTLADAMIQLLDDKALRKKLARLGQIQAAKFSWEKTALETLQVYQQTIQNQ